jgi:hypothetical protein
MTELHALGHVPEIMACGLAEDAFVSGDHDKPIFWATQGQKVTCISCLRAIEHYKFNYVRSAEGFKYSELKKQRGGA